MTSPTLFPLEGFIHEGFISPPPQGPSHPPVDLDKFISSLGLLQS